MAKWSKREHGKSEIDRVAAKLLPWWTQPSSTHPDDLGKYYGIVQNWRSSHAMPLLVFRGHLAQRAESIDPKPIIAQRLKRFSSIMNKLVREPHMKLSQMQDLGGCRAIVSDIEALNSLFALYRYSNDDFLQSDGGMKCSNYVKNPKLDGYRGIHLVGRYKARAAKNEPWNGHRIEIQLRTKLQHAFATAVETVTTFTRSPLKFGGGPDLWRRFFSLMGSALAIREATPLVPGTPTEYDELIRELREITKTLRVLQRLRGWTKALNRLPKREMADAKWILLVLDVSEDTIQTTGFTDPKKAVQAVAAIETSDNAAQLDAVLVGVSSIRSLRSAYPNYYADTASFVAALNTALAEPGRPKRGSK
ncbi:RelA/SpoT domain-containing protein [Granulicella sp. dw_53]|uniref:RelA/SpoT domain-containing protein n=1 Tax=Granulicella sp. dw_53 TaxID=2719792 RepID=UPI001BD23931|nr:RelA/SpoT domain-containing protein [Granulicella sp. dw_53]